MKNSVITYQDGFRIKDGCYYTSVLLYNPTVKRNVRYPINPPVTNLDDALAFKRKIELSLGITKARVKKRFEFLQKFHTQELLFTGYIEYQKKASKRAWKENVSRLKNYVFPFFIGQLNLNHPALWYDHWNEFHESLKQPIRKNTKTKELASNTKDNIISAANTFISYVELKESGGSTPIKKLPFLFNEEKGCRGLESIYSEVELKSVLDAMVKANFKDYAKLFYILSKTGLRVSEGLGLMIGDVVIGSIPKQEKWIFNAIKDKTPLYGYILLKSQPFDSNRLIINGEVRRAPLKSKKKIAAENNRIIPLIDKDLSQILLNLKHMKTESGLLFEGHSYREFYKFFTEIKTLVKLSKTKDIHSLRHSFATYFVDLCDGDPRITEKVLGHSSRKMTMRYNHLSQELQTLNYVSKDEVNEIEF